MGKIIRFLDDLFFCIKRFRHILFAYRKSHPGKRDFGSLPNSSSIALPCHIGVTKNVYIDDYVKIRYGLTVINSKTENVYIKKFTEIAPDVTIVTNSHVSTVSVPQVLLGESHINDKSADVTITEDVWIGTRVTILPGVTVGRGAIIAANAVVTKSVPPYALVVGIPAKIVGVKFSLEDIMKHEEALYPPEERMSMDELRILFEKHFQDKKVFGCNNPLSVSQVDVLNKLKSNRHLDLYPVFNQVSQ